MRSTPESTVLDSRAKVSLGQLLYLDTSSSVVRCFVSYCYTKPYYQRLSDELTQAKRSALWFVFVCRRCLTLSVSHLDDKNSIVAPQKRYVFKSPSTLRLDVRRRELDTSPFVCLWFCSLDRWRERALATFRCADDAASLFRSHAQLPPKLKSSFDKSRKKLRKNQRDANKKNKKQR